MAILQFLVTLIYKTLSVQLRAHGRCRCMSCMVKIKLLSKWSCEQRKDLGSFLPIPPPDYIPIMNLFGMPTMSANSLGTLPVIYAVDEQQNPLPRKIMLCGGDTNSTGGGNYVFPSS